MAIICRELKLLFIMTPRTACTAVGNLLLNDYGGAYLPAEDISGSDGRVRIQKKHSTLGELIRCGLLSKSAASDLLKFASIRNPFDSLVSLYLKQRSKYQPLLDDPNSWVSRDPTYVRNMQYARTHSFAHWVARKCGKQLLKSTIGAPASMFQEYTAGTDVVVRYENIAQELDAVLERAGAAVKAQLPVVNRTEEREHNGYRKWYSRATKSAVRFAFSDDFKHYGYRF